MDKKRRVPKVLSKIVYCYLEPANKKHAKTKGAKLFGSLSAYLNALVSKDRGASPVLGTWKTPGENKEIRKEAKKKFLGSKKKC